MVLVGVGRRPNTGGLDLERAGVATDQRGWVQVDDQLRTSAPAVHAIGDVTGRCCWPMWPATRGWSPRA